MNMLSGVPWICNFTASLAVRAYLFSASNIKSNVDALTNT